MVITPKSDGYGLFEIVDKDSPFNNFRVLGWSFALVVIFKYKRHHNIVIVHKVVNCGFQCFIFNTMLLLSATSLGDQITGQAST